MIKWLCQVAGFFVTAFFGAGIFWVVSSSRLAKVAPNFSYADLAAILLTAVAVIVAIFAGVLALAAVWGFSQLKRDAIRAAEQAGTAELKQQIEKGQLREYIRGEIARLADEEFKSDQMDRRINSRVDAVTFGRSNDDRLLEDEELGK